MFCDECIEKILHTVKNEPVDEAVIYDVEEKIFYPIKRKTCRLEVMKFRWIIQMETTDLRLFIQVNKSCHCGL